MNWIEHIVEPKRLLLVWQAPDHMLNRRRYAVGEVSFNGERFVFQYFDQSRFEIENDGAKLLTLEPLGFQGYAAFKTKQAIHREGVLETLLRRLPPRDRSDFAAYQQHFRIKPDTKISDFALLAYTEAKLPNDGFSLVDPLQHDVQWCERMLEVAGFRHHTPQNGALSVGANVELRCEPENLYDKNAVGVFFDGHSIGYLNRLQALTFSHWMTERHVLAKLERINGTADRPTAYVFVRVAPKGAVAAA